jgi:hypothetical protein
MTELMFFVAFTALCVVAVITSALDMRPDRRPPEWSVGRLIEPRR